MQKIFTCILRIVNKTYPLSIFFLCIQIKPIFSQQATQDLNKIRTVIIDAGHGGKDSGALGELSMEKDLALAISLKTGKYIEERLPDVKVVYTRTTDVFLALHERAKIANDNDADLFISVHINSSSNKLATGTESLVLGLHRTNENFEVAKRENQVILLEDNYSLNYEGFDPNSEESYIMFSLMQNIYDEHSISFADAVQYQFRERAGRKDRGVRRQGLLVLAQTAMPGVLVEAGFISNPAEEKYLLTEEGQDYIASAIFRAFRNYKQIMEGTLPDLSASESGNNQKANAAAKSDSAKYKNNNSNSSFPTYVSSENNNIKNVSDTLVFKVQVLFSANKIEKTNDLYNQFNDVEEILFDGKYKYVVGCETKYNNAVEYSKLVKNRYPDAFIVAVSKGKIIPLSDALKNKEN